ncbi:ZP domain-containing protein-like [Hippoglossus stenolepis]|uniref:ZP domain-containing protein-like n=1 Tax=Hippoglossus stenolepis TaxID=195615 RepID=UPI001FAF8237|nr:ZP domain-containing protein-like [Hippoglossus stenolepis]
MAPLSKLPMQFSFLVDPPAPSCQEGAFLPKFLPPTPANGDRFLAEVNKELEIRVKAQATDAKINNIVVSGPANIRKHQNTQGEFVLRWTPLPDDHGQHFVICFAVEAVKSPAVYQSEMRCVVVEARSEIVKSHVICNESSMTVSVEKASFPRLHEDHMQLNDPSNTACSLQRHSNSTHIIAIIPLNACGTQIEEDNENLIFKNEITTVDNPSDLITRKHQMEVQFYCQYPKQGNVSLSFVAHRKNITVWEKGFGTFTYQFEFYPNNQFQTMMDPAAYPLEYDIGNRIYMKIKATSSVNNTELFVESCRAAPYDNPNYQPTYSIFENGCKMDPTVQIHSPAEQKEFKFSMEAFKFIGLNNQVYISCSVMMCEAGNSNTRCSKGCISSTSTSPPRPKREAVIQSASHFVSQGPLRLRRSAESVRATATNLNLNLVFIAGCVLAAVGMVCGVVVYRAKVSKVKYQPLPTFES